MNQTTLNPINNSPSFVTKEISKIGAQDIVIEITKKIEFIYNTPIVDKLRFISERKWYHFFSSLKNLIIIEKRIYD